MAAIPLDNIKDHFPLLKQAGAPVYLDSAATSQKPQVVIDRLQRYYAQENANVHRGIYALSETATREFEAAREEAARFLHAKHLEEVIFTRGTTEAINLVAQCFAGQLQAGDEILLSVAEHHSNIVPWQMVAERYQLSIKYIPLTPSLRLDMSAARQLISSRTKLISIAHISNVLGVIHPIEEIIRMAREVGAKVMIDGAQGAVHLPLDVQKLDCDFYAFSGHKVLGPTGIGVLYGKKDLLDAMPPYQGGGDMIEQVSLKGSTWNQLPSKFEAGTPNIAGAIGLAEALRFLQNLPRSEALQHERALGEQILEVMASTKAKALVSPGDDWVGIVPFYHPDIHPHDLASICDSENVCIRAGHHCAQPLMEYLGVSATARLSPYIYNTSADIEQFARALTKAEKLFC